MNMNMDMDMNMNLNKEIKIYITRHKRDISDIIKNIEKHNIDYCIVDDTPNHIKNDKTISLDKPTGKENFYLKHNLIYNDFIDSSYNYIIIIQDDFVDFDIDRIIEDYKNNPDCVMKIMRDSRTKCWINKEQEFYNKTHFKEYFVDCHFMTSKDIYKQFGYMDKNPHINGRLSSGVGMYHSIKLNELNIKILSPIISYIVHGEHESMMHYEERKVNPLKSTRTYHRPIIISMATFDSRNYLPTLKSLLNQSIIPNKIYIYDNEDEDESNIDHNSNSKFYITTKELPRNAILLTVDDDIIYDYYYIERMIMSLSKSPWITIHGRKWHSYPIKSYKSADKMYAFNRTEYYDGFIDVGGTGVSCFDLSKIDTENLFDYIIQEDRMDDVMVSCFLREQNIKPYHISHEALRYIQNKNTCYNTTTIYDTKHIELINKTFKNDKERSNKNGCRI